eukprot:531386-Amphidinium_carterae.2
MTALGNGVVKMNVDTDTQWAYWEGILNFYKAKEGYLQGDLEQPSFVARDMSLILMCVVHSHVPVCLRFIEDRLVIQKVQTSPTRATTTRGSGFEKAKFQWSSGFRRLQILRPLHAIKHVTG